MMLTTAQLPDMQLQVENAGTLVKEEKALLRAGSGSITDYLLSVKNYLSVHRSLNQYEIRILQIQNEINFWKQ